MSKQKKVVVKKTAVKAAKKAAAPAPAPIAKKATKKAAVVETPAPVAKKATKKAEAPAPVATPTRETKKGKALEMLRDGATVFQLMEAFGWLRHTTRGFLCILGKTYTIETFKNEKGEHTYKLAAA